MTALDPMTREKVAARIWRAVFDPPPTMMWSHKGDVPDVIAERCRTAAQRLADDGLLAVKP